MYPGGFSCLNDLEAPSGVKLDSLTDDDLFGVVKKVVCITGGDSLEFQRLMADSIPGFFSPKVTCLSLID